MSTPSRVPEPPRLPKSAPLWCRLRHNWKPRSYWPGWTRATCHRCEDL